LVNLFRKLRDQLRRVRPKTWLRQIWHSPHLFGANYTLVDNTVVTLYTDQPEQFPGYRPVRSLSTARAGRSVKFSVVATALNESKTARIILIDTGSNDNTLTVLQELAKDSPVPIRVLFEAGARISRGRNLAIASAQSPVIVVTDFGCVLPDDWLENMVAPFEDDPRIEFTAGRVNAVDRHGQPTRWLLGRTLAQINPQNHLPTGNSTAFTKEAWQRVGGYPEWMSLTGEDTYFDSEIKRTTSHWGFVPEAAVQWQAPDTVPGYLKKAFQWSVGDGEAGTNTHSYRWAAVKISVVLAGAAAMLTLVAAALITQLLILIPLTFVLIGLVLVQLSRTLRKRQSRISDELLLFGVYCAEVLGFLKGLRLRPAADQRRFAGLQGIFFILAGVPIDDTGGGARWAQIAMELIKRQYRIVFINKYPKYETVDLKLLIRHPNLQTYALEKFQWEKFQAQNQDSIRSLPISALVEFPHPDFEPIAKHIAAVGGTVIFDLLDDWDSALGSEWYSPEVERRIIADSHVLTATAPTLQNRLEEISGRPVAFLPNAVNSSLFNPARIYDRPEDLPRAAWLAAYVGALWGEWFDWDLLRRVAVGHPHAGVIVIGDYAGQFPDPPPNLHFLGLKRQQDLPAYLAHIDTAIIPWEISDITRATSPLKLYEYLAMQRPVVAPRLAPLEGIPGVYLSNSREEFVAAVGTVRESVFPVGEVAAFISENNWGARVDKLLGIIEHHNQP
jgi:cellulose synthase/poly-beta-1,6-N-acetylglucosamine synthase-like glycosyltransferase